MHIYFSGIGGVGLGPLAEIALDAGYDVSGSDMSESPMFTQLQQRGASISIGQEVALISQLHAHRPIDWFVYTSALPYGHPELEFARSNGIKTTKRDELLAHIIQEKNLKLIAVAGTHGKTTTSAMLVWALQQLNIPVSYSIGTTLSWGPSGHFAAESEYFVYECDEFDRNFLHFTPWASVITNIDYDHADTYPTQEDYLNAFDMFIQQSKTCIMWRQDVKKSTQQKDVALHAIDKTTESISHEIDALSLVGRHNRENAYLGQVLLTQLMHVSESAAQQALSSFPGTARRFEKILDNLYSDYAHHPEEITATLQLAHELSDNVVAVYQPHQNVRQYQVNYKDCFNDAQKVYWLPTYLSREDESLAVLTPQQLSQPLGTDKVVFAEMNPELQQSIDKERNNGALVVVMGAGSIDEWVRKKFTSSL